MKEVQLTTGGVALVDDEDYERVMTRAWWKTSALSNNSTTYAVSNDSILMHRFILNVYDDRRIDHENGNGLDNQRNNIRVATLQQNRWNCVHEIGASGFIGVEQLPSGRFYSRIRNNGKRVGLGTFDTAVEAAKMYDFACLLHRGEFAVTNGDIGAYHA